MSSDINRRDFLKLVGLGGVVFASTLDLGSCPGCGRAGLLLRADVRQPLGFRGSSQPRSEEHPEARCRGGGTRSSASRFHHVHRDLIHASLTEGAPTTHDGIQGHRC